MDKWKQYLTAGRLVLALVTIIAAGGWCAGQRLDAAAQELLELEAQRDSLQGSLLAKDLEVDGWAVAAGRSSPEELEKALDSLPALQSQLTERGLELALAARVNAQLRAQGGGVADTVVVVDSLGHVHVEWQDQGQVGPHEVHLTAEVLVNEQLSWEVDIYTELGLQVIGIDAGESMVFAVQQSGPDSTWHPGLSLQVQELVYEKPTCQACIARPGFFQRHWKLATLVGVVGGVALSEWLQDEPGGQYP